MPLVVADEHGRRRFDDADFPVAVGLTKEGTLELGAAAEAAPAFWVLAHQEGLSVQPERSRALVTWNGAALREPAWLKHGDEIALGGRKFAVAIDDGECILGAIPAATADNHGPSRGEGAGTPPAGKGGGRPGRTGGTLITPARIAASIFAVLLLGVLHVIIASPVHLRVTPPADSVAWSGFPPPVPVGDRYLALPGDYVVEARKDGYRPVRQDVQVAYGNPSTIELTLRRLPGQLRIATTPIDGATIFVDGIERGASPLQVEVEAGPREIRAVSERYLTESRLVDVQGMGEVQAVEIALRPAWGTLSVTTTPPKAIVRLDGREVGETPLSIEALQGVHDLEVSKPGWKTLARRVEIRAAATHSLPMIELERVDGTLELSSDPSGAAVVVDGQFRGHTPLSLALVGERSYRLEVSKAGYVDTTREVRLDGGATTRLSLQLLPELGTVFITTDPPGAALAVNGRPSGSATQRLTLQTVPQIVEIAKSGYESFKTVLTPQRGVAKRLDVTLKTAGDALKERAAKGIFTPAGQRMALIHLPQPVRFTVGSSRGDPGRRSNEPQYPVALTRSFLVSEKEVTNAEFRKFRPAHSSGSHQGASLDGPDQPVVNVGWDDAARYANWLSAQEGLSPAYAEHAGRMVPVRPLTDGYRLPTEAEWEFIARYDGGRRSPDRPLQFPWGDSLPAPNNSGNYAHQGSGLPFAMPGYVDPFPVSAPVGKFPPGQSLIFDLGGNVAEWCHDYYDVPVGEGDGPRADPAGPSEGRFHVVKGAGWRSGGASELRLAYRDYAEKPRDDLGFRVVRYVDPAR